MRPESAGRIGGAMLPAPEVLPACYGVETRTPQSLVKRVVHIPRTL